jgi:hypothetical protein
MLRLLATSLLLLSLGCDAAAPPPTDAGADAPIPRTRETIPPAGALTAGIAEVRLPVPLGIGTMGYGAIGATKLVTPFSDVNPGTTRAHGSLTFRAVALSRGDAHEVIFVRLDTIGVFQQLREAVLDELETRLGRRLDDSLILASNHTHSGPGRLLNITGALTALGDTFFPEVYDRVVDALSDVVEQALADRRPAEVGWAIAQTSDAHDDRRCENDPLPQIQESPDMPLVAVRREGRLDAIVAAYAYHGTILGLDDHTLSGDMGSVVEQRVEERFDHPVLVLFLNSWGADMSPGSPAFDPGAVGAPQPDGYDRMQRLGDVVGDVIVPATSAMTFSSDLAVRARTHRVRLDTEVIGYTSLEFPYFHGGAFCGIGADGNCMSIMPIMGLSTRCIRISASDNLPKQTLFTSGRVGDLFFVTAPGEWSTALADGVLDTIRGSTGGDAMLVGYANDYNGYSVGEDDWWQGGYEASGALWGPRQGDYLAARAVESFATFYDEWNEPPWLEPAPVPAFSGYTYDPYVPEAALDLGSISTDVPATVAQTDTVSFVVHGSDPWLGVPVATLERDDGTGTFAPVVRPQGEAVDSEGYDFWVDLTTEPTYDAMLRAPSRTFSWTFHFPIARLAGSRLPPFDAAPHRFSIRVPATGGERVVTTGTFTVSP